MADDRPGGDLDLGNEDAGLAFRAEMAASHFFATYWKGLLAVIGVGLLGVLVYSQWRDMHQASQRKATAAIADIETTLSDDVLVLAQRKAGLIPGDEIDVTPLREAGTELLDLAQEGSGTAAVEAALKAAEMFRIAEAPDLRRQALQVAEQGASGVLRYSAVAALANLDVEEDKVDSAIARFESLLDEEDYLARQATLDLAATYEALDRYDEALSTYESYLTRWPDAPDTDEVLARRDKASRTDG